MTLKEFKKLWSGHDIIVLDITGKDISYKPEIISNLFTVIGSEHNPDGTIVVDVDYID